MQITRKDLLSALRSRLLAKFRAELEFHQKKLNDLDKDEPKECLSDSADALGTAKIKNSAAFKTLVGKLDRAKIKYVLDESHGTDYNADKPGQRRTTIAVRVKFDPFTALTVPATSLRKAIDRHTAKTKTVRNTVENLRKKVQTLANGEGTDILTNVLSETMVSDEPAMKAMMQRLETAVDQAMRS
jgi:hypothetical protein